MFKSIVNYFRYWLHWLHWIVYGEWWIGIETEDDNQNNVEIKEYSEQFDDSVVATPYIKSGYSQK